MEESKAKSEYELDIQFKYSQNHAVNLEDNHWMLMEFMGVDR
jgi:hypothetical protein